MCLDPTWSDPGPARCGWRDLGTSRPSVACDVAGSGFRHHPSPARRSSLDSCVLCSRLSCPACDGRPHILSGAAEPHISHALGGLLRKCGCQPEGAGSVGVDRAQKVSFHRVGRRHNKALNLPDASRPGHSFGSRERAAIRRPAPAGWRGWADQVDMRRTYEHIVIGLALVGVLTGCPGSSDSPLGLQGATTFIARRPTRS